MAGMAPEPQSFGRKAPVFQLTLRVPCAPTQEALPLEQAEKRGELTIRELFRWHSSFLKNPSPRQWIPSALKSTIALSSPTNLVNEHFLEEKPFHWDNRHSSQGRAGHTGSPLLLTAPCLPLQLCFTPLVPWSHGSALNSCSQVGTIMIPE